MAFVVRFLSFLTNAETTWVPGLSMKDTSGAVLEVDFLMWWRPQFESLEPILLLGECKTFNKFELRDFDRAAKLAEIFPGAILVFATLRNELEFFEKDQIARLARAGRENLADGRWRAPVLVLTGHELMSEFGPPSCWEGMEAVFTRVPGRYPDKGNLNELCDRTQQLHLDIESYDQWWEEKYAKTRLRAPQANDTTEKR